MALTQPTLAGTSLTSTTNATSYATASMSPTNGKVYCVWVFNTQAGGATVTPTLTGWGQTWVEVGHYINGGQVTLFRCVTTASSAGALTASFGATNATGCVIIAHDLPGAPTTNNGADAFRLANVVTGGAGAATSLSLTMGGFAAGSSGVIAGILLAAANAITPDATAGWVELDEQTYATPSTEAQCQWIGSNDGTVSWTFASAAPAGLAVEILDAVTAVTDGDTGSGADGESESATLTEADTGAGADADALAVQVSDGDTGAGADADALAVQVSDGDTGAGADAELSIGLSDADTGAGTETDALVVTATDAETSIGVDAEAQSVTLADADSGSGLDAEAVSYAIADTEAGAGTDSEAISVSIGDAETGTGTEDEDVVELGRPITDGDAGTGSDAEALVAQLGSADTGSAVESESVDITVADVDLGVAVEAEAFLVSLSSTDSGAGIESELVGIATVLRIRVSGQRSGPVSGRRPASSASGRGPVLVASGREPGS